MCLSALVSLLDARFGETRTILQRGILSIGFDYYYLFEYLELFLSLRII